MEKRMLLEFYSIIQFLMRTRGKWVKKIYKNIADVIYGWPQRKELQVGGLNSEILLYHGTASANTDSICKTNFKLDMSVRFAHGRGIYLSRLVFPQARSSP